MTRQGIARVLRMLGLIAAAATLVAAIQFVRGEAPNPLLWVVTPTPTSDGVVGMVFSGIASVYGWLAGLGIYLVVGMLMTAACVSLSRIIEVGWKQYRAARQTAEVEYERWATFERARQERRRKRESVRAMTKPSSVGAVLFGLALGWFLFH